MYAVGAEQIQHAKFESDDLSSAQPGRFVHAIAHPQFALSPTLLQLEQIYLRKLEEETAFLRAQLAWQQNQTHLSALVSPLLPWCTLSALLSASLDARASCMHATCDTSWMDACSMSCTAFHVRMEHVMESMRPSCDVGCNIT